jgi:hypothetical protein
MKTTSFKFNAFALLLAGLMLISSCSSTTRIQSIPNGAKIYVDGVPVGRTPFIYTDTKISGSKTSVRLEAEGYEPLDTYFYRDEQVDAGAIVGGIFLWVPFLWTMKYFPEHNYEMAPLWLENEGDEAVPAYQDDQPLQQPFPSKADRLRDLKNLLDEKILTQEEFEQEKKKILDEDYKEQ